MKITLPWLHPKLSPNARTHWAVRSKLVKEARYVAEVMTLSVMESWERDVYRFSQRIPVTITFNPPDKRHRDKQNMPASYSTKAYLDGIADAIGVDDNLFHPTFAYGEIVKGGAVVVEVSI